MVLNKGTETREDDPLDRAPDVYKRYKRARDSKSGVYFERRWCYNLIVNFLLLNDTNTLDEEIQEIREGTRGQRAALYADELLADFIRHGVLDGLREVEVPMRAAYRLFTEAYQKRKDARLATEEATHTWDGLNENFRPKLEVFKNWAESEQRAKICRFLNGVPGYINPIDAPCSLRSASVSAKPYDFLDKKINFIREMLEGGIIAGRLDLPVGISDFESYLKALEVARDHLEARKAEEAATEAAFESAKVKYDEERSKAIAVLQLLSEAGRCALLRLVRCLRTEPLPL